MPRFSPFITVAPVAIEVGAAAMMAPAQVMSRLLRGDVLVCCVADEEHASSGTAEVLERFTADAGIVTEPMSLQPALAHKGFAWLDVTIHGRAAHGPRPGLVIDAITEAGHVLDALDMLADQLAAQAGDPAPVRSTRH